MTKYKKISVSVDRSVDLLLEKSKANKSKLINFLIAEFFRKNKDLKKFIKNK